MKACTINNKDKKLVGAAMNDQGFRATDVPTARRTSATDVQRWNTGRSHPAFGFSHIEFNLLTSPFRNLRSAPVGIAITPERRWKSSASREAIRSFLHIGRLVSEDWQPPHPGPIQAFAGF